MSSLILMKIVALQDVILTQMLLLPFVRCTKIPENLPKLPFQLYKHHPIPILG